MTAMLAVAAGPVAAAAPALSNGSVTPTSGTTTTTFTFGVTYTPGTQPVRRALSATATFSNVVSGANVVVALTRVSEDGQLVSRWSGQSQLPVGTWAVTFSAVPESGPTPLPLTLAQQVVVVGPPTPTPAPTPPPTPTPPATPTPSPVPTPTAVPTARPTAIAPTPLPSGAATASPASGEPSGSAEPTPFGTTVGSGSEAASVTPTATPGGGPGGGEDVEGQLTSFLTGGVAAIGLLAAVGFAAIYADRRRNRQAGGGGGGGAASPPPGPFPTSTASTKAGRQRPRAGWEDYALDDEPIGTIEYEPPSQD